MKKIRLEKLKRFIASIIEPKAKPSVISIIYNILMSLLIVASCAAVFIDLFTPADSLIHKVAATVELVAVITFIVEYVLKLFVSEIIYEGQGWFKSKISYITSFDSLIDIICILSVFLNQIPKEFAALRLLKLVKLVRLVKLKDAVDEIRDVNEESTEKKEKKFNFKKRVHEIIFKDNQGDKLSKAYDIVSIVIILLSVTTIVLDTFTFPEPVEKTIYWFEVGFTIFFVIDYILRVWTAEFEYPELDREHARTKYIFSFIAIIDLLAILPIFFSFSPDAEAAMPTTVAVLKIFKIFKITRLLKASRYLNGLNMFVQAIKKKKKQILFSVVILALLLVLFSVLLYSFESMSEDNQFDNGFSGIAYLLTILSGVNSDAEIEALHTMGGKVMVALMIISGGCIIGVPIGIISGEFEHMLTETTKEENEVSSEDDLFEEFAKTLTNEQKLEIIRKYSPHKDEEENNEGN